MGFPVTYHDSHDRQLFRAFLEFGLDELPLGFGDVGAK